MVRTIVEVIISFGILYCIADEDRVLNFINGKIEKHYQKKLDKQIRLMNKKKANKIVKFFNFKAICDVYREDD